MDTFLCKILERRKFLKIKYPNVICCRDKVVTAFYNEAFSRRVVDSEDESDDESDSDEGDDEDERQQGWSGVDSELSEEASGSWCSIT